MCMNSRDERLYHYEYRTPRLHNPTYNSSNVFDSLNMFVRTDLPDPLMRSHLRYSLPHNRIQHNLQDEMDSRTRRPLNYNTIQHPADSPRRDVLLSDKDYLYLQMIEERKKQAQRLPSGNRRMGNSSIIQNAQHFEQRNMGKGDSLSNQLREFEAHRK